MRDYFSSLWKYESIINAMVLVAPRPKTKGPYPYRALGLRIAELRERAGLTQYQLADAIGVSRGYPGSFETGRGRPDAAILRQIARVVHADYNELAQLAGYLEERPQESPIYAPPEKDAVIRQILSYPLDLLHEVEAYLRVRSTYPERPKRVANDEAEEQQGGVTDEDESQSDLEGPARR